MKLIKTFLVNPIGKPRMTRADTWKKRPAVQRYWAYKDILARQRKGFVIPESDFQIIFYLLMPKSWNHKKKAEMLDMPCKNKPDIDNVLKGFFDCLCREDKQIWDVRATKIWAEKGKIEVYVEEICKQKQF